MLSMITSYVTGLFFDENVLKLAVAAVIGIIIGLERELKHKPAGLKTAMILTVGSCLLTIVSLNSANIYSEAYVKPMDPLRLAAQVISGIGFIGGGIILVRKNDVISGLTTAVIIWVSGAIGIAVGAGFYKESIITMVFIMLAVQLIPFIVQTIGPKGLKEKEIKVRLYTTKDVKLTELVKQMKSYGYRIHSVKVKEEAQRFLLSCIVMTDREMYTTEVFYEIRALEGIEQVEVDNLR